MCSRCGWRCGARQTGWCESAQPARHPRGTQRLAGYEQTGPAAPLNLGGRERMRLLWRRSGIRTRGEKANRDLPNAALWFTSHFKRKAVGEAVALRLQPRCVFCCRRWWKERFAGLPRALPSPSPTAALPGGALRWWYHRRVSLPVYATTRQVAEPAAAGERPPDPGQEDAPGKFRSGLPHL